MNLMEMLRTVENSYDTIKETGEIGLELKSKLLHFNKECTLSSHEKKQLASRINGRIRCLRSVASMEKATRELKDQGKKLTRKSVSVNSGLSLKTVSRNWNKSLEGIFTEINEYNRRV